MDELKKDKDFKNKVNQLIETLLMVCYQSFKKEIAPYAKWIEIIEKTSRDIQKNANIDLALDNMIIQICY